MSIGGMKDSKTKDEESTHLPYTWGGGRRGSAVPRTSISTVIHTSIWTVMRRMDGDSTGHGDVPEDELLRLKKKWSVSRLLCVSCFLFPLCFFQVGPSFPETRSYCIVPRIHGRETAWQKFTTNQHNSFQSPNLLQKKSWGPARFFGSPISDPKTGDFWQKDVLNFWYKADTKLHFTPAKFEKVYFGNLHLPKYACLTRIFQGLTRNCIEEMHPVNIYIGTKPTCPCVCHKLQRVEESNQGSWGWSTGEANGGTYNRRRGRRESGGPSCETLISFFPLPSTSHVNNRQGSWGRV